MLIDITGIPLTPGNGGEDCLGDGKHVDEDGDIIECCCDECDFLACCISEDSLEACALCKIYDCPRKDE